MIFKGISGGGAVDLTLGKEYYIGVDGRFKDDVGDSRSADNFEWEAVANEPGIYGEALRNIPEMKPSGVLSEVKADRFNEGKPQLSYMLDAPKAMIGLSRVFEAGAKKYSRDNWKKGLERNELIDCLMRHLIKAQAGQVNDEETGCNHLNHVLWNALVLAEQFNEEEFDGKE